MIPEPKCSNEEFVEFCYQRVLRRASDPQGREEKIAALNRGLSRLDLLLQFLDCPEFLSRASEWVPPGHFYSPIPNLQDIADRLKDLRLDAQACPNLDMRDNEQVRLLNALAAYYPDQPFSAKPSAPLRYYFDNDSFPYGDALVLYAMLRHFKPSQIIEIGSGYSSAVMLDTNDLFLEGSIRLTFIEPYPQRLYGLLSEDDKGHHRVVEQPVQKMPVAVFRELKAGDILFVDSTHVAKCNSDVLYVFFEIIPSLADGVLIHFHDIFWPFEYPAKWLQEGRAWNEAYFLRTFLEYNHRFQVVYGSSYMAHFHSDLLQEKMPLVMRNTGGSFWLKKLPA
ncbi:MAG TPA: class I SAM-dependent methyltransferase [Verrucomicrobiae bacterium]|nr:class I SAM-dependent methyltransferase [Verrucomicrobiae bacterium]